MSKIKEWALECTESNKMLLNVWITSCKSDESSKKARLKLDVYKCYNLILLLILSELKLC